MAFGDYEQIFGGHYNLGGARDFTLNTGATVSSNVLNTRDLGSIGAPDFPVLGPGAQVWIVGYSVLINSPAILATDALGLFLEVLGSYNDAVPFTFFIEQEIKLPVYSTFFTRPSYSYSGHVRVESPAVQLRIVNVTGQDLVIMYQFWGKAF